MIAMRLTKVLTPAELKALFPQLVALASWDHGMVQAARDRILSLPRDWVLQHIEEVAEPLLQEGDYVEYRRFLELYVQLDPELAARLARRAAAHADSDVKEAGEDFLEALGRS